MPNDSNIHLTLDTLPDDLIRLIFNDDELLLKNAFLINKTISKYLNACFLEQRFHRLFPGARLHDKAPSKEKAACKYWREKTAEIGRCLIDGFGEDIQKKNRPRHFSQ